MKLPAENFYPHRRNAVFLSRSLIYLMMVAGTLLWATGCQTLQERGEFRFTRVPEAEAKYTVVVETISDVIVFTDYEAMEPLVVETLNEAGLRAFRMFEGENTPYYLYVLLQRTDEAAGELPPSGHAGIRAGPFAPQKYRYVRGQGLQREPAEAEEIPESPNFDTPRLAVLFTLLEAKDLEEFTIDSPPPAPMMEGLFFMELDGEHVSARELREVTRITAERILTAEKENQASF